jgi:subfamily B ATP-binding cassette protein HlyB/CyaB
MFRRTKDTSQQIVNKESTEPTAPSIDAGLFCFVTVAHFHGINASPDQITHALAIGPEGMDEGAILRAAKELKLKAKVATVDFKQLQKLPMPVIVGMHTERFAVLASVDDEKALVLLPGETAPTVFKASDFKENWNKRVLLFTQRFWY